ncbi:MAG: isoprenylcysteine carboxylmethyltransferase family protein [Dehalococcoidia bacterium]|nr:isoprenylcysteine carboxylmethyltransferase family protein [Dehalococcoidia bacterium]
MSRADRYAEFLSRIAMTRNKLKIIMTPVGAIFWFGLSALLVFASLWLDKLLPVRLPLATPTNIFVSLPVIVIGSALAIWPFITFLQARGTPVPLNPPQKLVVKGLYAYIRNPMVLGWLILLFGIGILLNSIFLIFVFTPLFAALNILYLKTIEEKEMEKKFGEEYLKYKQSVPMFIPRLRKQK